MGTNLLINRRALRMAAAIVAILTAGSLACTLIVMAFRFDDGENTVLALSLGILIPLLCATPVAIVVASQSARLAELNDLLAYEASHDSLTELPNRRAFLDQLDRRFDVAEPTAVLLIDADRFKEVNDEHGHHTGDEALIAMANLFTGETPAGALVARLGGEEFGVLLPKTSLTDAQQVAERLRKAIEDSDFCSPEGAPCPLTVSIGVDVLRIEDRTYPMRGADFALYAAKKAGRNRVTQYAAVCVTDSDEKAA